MYIIVRSKHVKHLIFLIAYLINLLYSWRRNIALATRQSFVKKFEPTLLYTVARFKMISAPAAERNKEPILSVLKENLDASKQLTVLEIASGTGQHIVHFAKHFSKYLWQPSDVNANNFKSISSYSSMLPNNNVLDPVQIDVSIPVESWPENVTANKFDIIYCSNLIHISPYSCTIGLFSSAGKLLKPETGVLITYGPYAENGVLTPESNVRFDEGLKMQCPDWGVRDIVDLVKLAEQNGLKYVKKIEMPANNKMLFFLRA